MVTDLESDTTPGNQPTSPQFGSKELKEAEDSAIGRPKSLNSSSSTGGRVKYNTGSQPKTSNPDELSSSTAPGKTKYDTSGNVSEPEQSLYNSSAASPGKIRYNFIGTRRRKTILGGGVVGTIIGLVFFAGLVSGPLEFIHFAELLKQFHFTNNQNFSDARTVRTILYTMNNQRNKTRLGIITNKFAGKWEGQLEKQIGLKPLYTNGPGNRFAGFAVTDEALAGDQLNDFERDGIDTHGSAANLVDSDGKAIESSSRVVNLTKEQFSTRRSLIRGVGKATDTSKIVSSIASRLLIKRGGVDFHPLKNIVRNKLDTLVKYRTKVRDEAALDDKKGVQAVDIPDSTAETDKDGKIINSADQTAASGSNDLIKQAEAAGAKGLEGQATLDSLKAGFTKAAGPALIIGVLCSVKAFGNNVPAYEYANTVLPEMRMGFSVISTGSQIESGQDVNADELGALSQRFNDPASQTSWINARSIQAELGQPQSGPDIPSSAKPGSLGKPKFFDILDKIPILGTACTLSGLVSKIPIIGGVVNYTYGQVLSGINFAITNTAGSAYTVDNLLNDALSIIAGQGANVFAQGAEFGNLANYGARLAANDQALADGGRALTPTESTQLSIENAKNSELDFQNHNVAYKLFNPYDEHSAISKLIDQTSPSFTQNISRISSLFLNVPHDLAALPDIFSGTAHAATPSSYAYGFPEYGFSATEQADQTFDNPFDNADKVEHQLGLANLNAKYGACFSMTVDPDTGDLVNGTAVKYSDIAQKPECNDGSDALLRYRFYIADTVTAKSLACYEGDDEPCTELGFTDSTTVNGTSATATATTGATN